MHDVSKLLNTKELIIHQTDYTLVHAVKLHIKQYCFLTEDFLAVKI